MIKKTTAQGQPKQGQPNPEGLLHELQVHQVELEMQNEELRRIQYVLEESRDHYATFYELALIGYLTLTAEGLIAEVNLAGAALLGQELSKLQNGHFARFVAAEDLDRWHHYFQRMSRHNGNQECELKLRRADGTVLFVRVFGLNRPPGDEPAGIALALIDITRPFQQENELREWQKFTENASWGMAIGDEETRTIRQANPAYAAMHGYTPSELNGMRADSLYAPKSRDDLPLHAEKFRKAGHLVFECERLRKDGSTFPASVEITGIQDAVGKAAFISNVRDITKKKRAESRLSEQELQYRILADSGQALIWTSGTDKLCNYFNQPWLNFTGRTLEQELGNGWAEGVHPDDAQRCQEIYVAAFDRREIFSIDYRLRHHSGEYRWIQDAGCPRYDSQGGFLGYIGHCLDINLFKASEEKQRKLSERIKRKATEYLDLYNSAPCGYHSLDKHGIIQRINETELNWLGYALNEIVGKRHFSDLLTADSFPLFQQNFLQIKETGELNDLELELVRKDGTFIPVLISSRVDYGADASFIRVRSTVYDMTERKKMEQERIGYLKRQEEASRHLVAVQEDARRRLSAELHDRTSPNLAAIDINLEIIATELPQEHSTDLAERLEDARALIVDTAASIREISTDLRPPLLDYAGLAAALESYAQQFTRRTGIVVQFVCENHGARLAPELESLLFRICQEALTNCAKHSRATSAMVTLIKIGRPIVLTITDNGVGFEPLQLGREGRIGLGLLNMREMAKVAGGALAIESTPGKGTRIAIEIA